MSQYITFYIRGDNKFYPIGTFCRNTEIYQKFYHEGGAPYEHIAPVTDKMITRVTRAVSSDVETYRHSIDAYEQNKIEMRTWNNSTEEKVEYLNEWREYQEELRESIAGLEKVIEFCDFLMTVMDEAIYSEYEEIEIDKYLYVGIEVYKPTLKDVVER